MRLTYTKKNRNKGGDTGFTLLEVLMAMVISSVGILSLISLQMTAINSNAHSRRVSEVSYQAAERLETLIGSNYGELVDGEASQEEYTIKWEVYTDTPIVNSKTVVVKVSHTRDREQRFFYMKFDKI